MSTHKNTVRRLFDEIAEEENLFKSDPNFFSPPVRTISDREIFVLEGLIRYRHDRFGDHSLQVRCALECRFDIEDLDELRSTDFLDAVVYLALFPGIN